MRAPHSAPWTRRAASRPIVGRLFPRRVDVRSPMFKCIHVIVNPVAGQKRPILGTLNRVFHPAGIDWEVKVTKQAGDARRYAQEAAAEGADAVAVNGGDGTVM